MRRFGDCVYLSPLYEFCNDDKDNCHWYSRRRGCLALIQLFTWWYSEDRYLARTRNTQYGILDNIPIKFSK